jgi:hypothetical protein
LDLQGVILGGHPDRHIMTLDLGEGLGPCFLKKEHRVRWKTRLTSWFAGVGWASKSVREARVLRAVADAGLGGPEVVAAGEAGGRAFLLMRAVADAVELRDYLASFPPGQVPSWAACWLGRELARFIAACFCHPDLYSKHLLVQRTPQGPRLVLVDWQRSRLPQGRVSSRQLQRMLAALDATLTPEWASDRNRLRCLKALTDGLGQRKSLNTLARGTRRHSALLQSQRRIREMAQPPLKTGKQNLIWLDGEALCVTREFQSEMGPTAPPWLYPPPTCDRAPRVEHASIEWHGRRLSLVRRWSNATARWWPKSSSFPAPEFAQAAALFRLERFRLPLPRLLAVGHQCRGCGLRFSFILTEPAAGAVPLDEFLEQQYCTARRHSVLRQAGALLRRLHDSGHGYAPAAALPAKSWGVDDSEDNARVVLMSVEGLFAGSADVPTLARRDLRRLMRGRSRCDALRLFLGYWGLKRLRGEGAAWRAAWRRTWTKARGRPLPGERGAVA